MPHLQANVDGGQCSSNIYRFNGRYCILCWCAEKKKETNSSKNKRPVLCTGLMKINAPDHPNIKVYNSYLYDKLLTMMREFPLSRP